MDGQEVGITTKLKKSGFSAKEAAVYSALIFLGGAFPSKIAESTGLNMSTVYKFLENLAVRGLFTELTKRNKLFYQVENPRNVERYAKSRITIAKRQLETTQDLLPVLEGLYRRADNKPLVKFFEGKDGVLKVYEDHVADAKSYEMLAFSNTAGLLKFLTADFRLKYIKRKQKNGITTRAILPGTEADIKYSETIYAGFPQKIWPKTKNVPRTMFSTQSDITIYGQNKVSIINFSGPQFTATIIEDKTIHDMMVMIFELAWLGVDLAAPKNRQDKK